MEENPKMGKVLRDWTYSLHQDKVLVFNPKDNEKTLKNFSRDVNEINKLCIVCSLTSTPNILMWVLSRTFKQVWAIKKKIWKTKWNKKYVINTKLFLTCKNEIHRMKEIFDNAKISIKPKNEWAIRKEIQA